MRLEKYKDSHGNYFEFSTINKSLSSFLGIGNHQIKIKAAIVNLKPINKKGGNCCIAGLAIAKPKPKSSGAHNASKISRKLKCSRLLYRNSFFRIKER